MNFTTTLDFPFHLGKTVEENSALLDDFFLNEKNFGTDLEGFLTLTGTDGEEVTWKIVSIVKDGKCVTARGDFRQRQRHFPRRAHRTRQQSGRRGDGRSSAIYRSKSYRSNI